MIPAESIISIIAAAIFCSLILRLSSGNTGAAKIMKLLAALFMLFAFIKLVLGLDFGNVMLDIADLENDADALVANAEKFTQDEIEDIIRNRIETYILDRAQIHGADLTVQVTGIRYDTMDFAKIYLKGNISPAVKKQMITEIEADLGIPEENQIWN